MLGCPHFTLYMELQQHHVVYIFILTTFSGTFCSNNFFVLPDKTSSVWFVTLHDVHVYVCVCVRAHACVHVHTHPHVGLCGHACVHMHMHLCVHLHAYLSVLTDAHMCTCTCLIAHV